MHKTILIWWVNNNDWVKPQASVAYAGSEFVLPLHMWLVAHPIIEEPEALNFVGTDCKPQPVCYIRCWFCRPQGGHSCPWPNWNFHSPIPHSHFELSSCSINSNHECGPQFHELHLFSLSAPIQVTPLTTSREIKITLSFLRIHF